MLNEQVIELLKNGLLRIEQFVDDLSLILPKETMLTIFLYLKNENQKSIAIFSQEVLFQISTHFQLIQI